VLLLNARLTPEGDFSMRDEGYNGESPVPEAETEVPDRVHVAMDALEIGTWSLDLASGQVDATPQTYQLFGLNPGTVEGSHDLFMRQVHPADRSGVEEWLSRSKHLRTRTALVFRVDHPDGSIHWVRSSGRVFRDRRGKAVRMVGVVEEVTDDLQGQPFEPNTAPPPSAGTSFSVRQVAHVLGLAEATLKRIAQSGNLKWLRSTRKNSRRFAPEDVIEYLRRGSRAEIDFDAAAAAEEMSSCLAYLLEQLMKGISIDELLDERVRPAAQASPAPFIADLLSRLPYIVPGRQRAGYPAVFVEVGEPGHLDSELIACALQAQGHEILRPAGTLEPAQLIELAERIRARLMVLLIGSGPVAIQTSVLAVAGAIASARPHTTVCVWSSDRLRVPRGVFRFRSMRELVSALRRS
jgi:PAS domain S-box-containing protein